MAVSKKLIFELRAIWQKEQSKPDQGENTRRTELLDRGWACVLGTQRPLRLAPGRPARILDEVGEVGLGRWWWGVGFFTEDSSERCNALTYVEHQAWSLHTVGAQQVLVIMIRMRELGVGNAS